MPSVSKAQKRPCRSLNTPPANSIRGTGGCSNSLKISFTTLQPALKRVSLSGRGNCMATASEIGIATRRDGGPLQKTFEAQFYLNGEKINMTNEHLSDLKQIMEGKRRCNFGSISEEVRIPSALGGEWALGPEKYKDGVPV